MLPTQQALPRWLFLLLVLAWVVPGLIGHDPWKPDESYIFGLVLEILQGGDWVVPHLAGEPFMEKPPLYFLTAAATAWLTSPWLALADGARLASGFYTALTAFFLYLAGKRLSGGMAAAGQMAVLLLLGCIGFASNSHHILTDTALFTGFTVALYGFALAQKRPLLAGFWLGTGAGMAFMSKGLIGVGSLGLAALLLPAIAPAFRQWRYAATLGVAALAALPWLLLWPTLLYLRRPDQFMVWFWDNNFGRYLGDNHLGPDYDPWYYLRILPWHAFPAFPAALLALWQGRRQLRQPLLAVPLSLLIALYLVLLTARTSMELYAVPTLLPEALLGGALLVQPAGPLLRRINLGLHYASLLLRSLALLLIWLVWGAFVYGLPKATALLNAYQPGYPAAWRALPTAMALLYLLLWLGWVRWSQRQMRQSDGQALTTGAASWAMGAAVVLGAWYSLWLGYVDYGKSYRQPFTELAQHLPVQRICLARYGSDVGEHQRGSLHYYTGIKTVALESAAGKRCDWLLSDTDKLPSEGWSKVWQGQRPGDQREIFRLWRRTPPG